MKRSQLNSAARTAFINDMPIIPGSIFFLCISSIIVILSAVNPALLTSARMTINDTFTPVLSVVRSPFDAVSTMIGDATGLAALKADNARLEEENARLREWYQRALALQVENKALQSLLNVTLAPSLEFTTARVLSDHSNAYAKTILIAAGQDQGVNVGQPVLGEEGVLGRVVEIGAHSARVLLLTDLNARIPVVLEGSNAHAISSGTNKPEPILTHLPADTQFKVGDRLLTSGLGGIYPAGLPVGVVSSVTSNEVKLTPYSNMDRIHYVRIITSPLTKEDLTSGL